ncbi:MAG: sigma-70 family RNA polymerase sigma factor [Planctomycetota bacterium]
MNRHHRIADEWLVLRAQDRDADAVRRLVDRWQGRLFRHALNVTGDAEAARDVSQEAWLGILKRLEKLNDPAAFPAWAYRVTNHKAVDWIRQASRRRQHQTPLPADLPATSSSTADELEDTTRRVHAALRRLTVDERALLSMYYLKDLSTAEIASALGIATGTVKSRLHRARQNLKPFLEGDHA